MSWAEQQPATRNQIAYIHRLARQAGIVGPALTTLIDQVTADRAKNQPPLRKGDAGRVIVRLKRELSGREGSA